MITADEIMDLTELPEQSWTDALRTLYQETADRGECAP